MRAGIGLTALLLAGSLEAQCIARGHLTIGYTIAQDRRLDVVRENKAALFSQVTSYFAEKGIDVEFKEGRGDYDLRFAYRHRIKDAWILWRWLQLGAAHPKHRHAYINIYRQTTPNIGSDIKGFLNKYEQTIEHEIGHLAGLGHVKEKGNLMYPRADDLPNQLTCEQLQQLSAGKR
jgi:hypothetical protein